MIWSFSRNGTFSTTCSGVTSSASMPQILALDIRRRSSSIRASVRATSKPPDWVKTPISWYCSTESSVRSVISREWSTGKMKLEAWPVEPPGLGSAPLSIWTMSRQPRSGQVPDQAVADDARADDHDSRRGGDLRHAALLRYCCVICNVLRDMKRCAQVCAIAPRRQAAYTSLYFAAYNKVCRTIVIPSRGTGGDRRCRRPRSPNPYTPGQVPRILAGRREELGRIRDQVGRVATYGELGGPLLVFHAPRGLGKTSLLRAAQRETAELGIVSVWVSCVRGHAGAARAGRRRRPQPRARRGGAARARPAPAGAPGWSGSGVELGVPGLKVSADLRSDAPAPDPPDRARSPRSRTCSTTPRRLVRERGGAGLLVLVDELHAAAARRAVAAPQRRCRTSTAQREENPLAVVTAGLPVTPEAITRAATFGERSSFVALDLLADADARSAVTAPAEALGVSWTGPALDAVVAESGGYPYFLQLLGSASLGGRRARPRATGSAWPTSAPASRRPRARSPRCTAPAGARPPPTSRRSSPPWPARWPRWSRRGQRLARPDRRHPRPGLPRDLASRASASSTRASSSRSATAWCASPSPASRPTSGSAPTVGEGVATGDPLTRPC